jgi:arsenate reductase
VFVLYGIPNCDTCRKARKWLDRKGIEYRFHDVRADGLDENTIRKWTGAVDWKKLLNTRSTTWRSLTDKDRQDLDEKRAIELMLQHPTLIKRPVAECRDEILVGFSEDSYNDLRP